MLARCRRPRPGAFATVADLLTADAGHRRLAVVDAAVVLWLVGCLTLGVQVRDEILGLTGLVTSVERVAGQAEGVAGAVGRIDLPLVGSSVGSTSRSASGCGAAAPPRHGCVPARRAPG